MSKAGQATNPTLKRFRKMNAPPPGCSWAWITRPMLESPAWRALPLYARQVVDRIMLEHLSHGGNENGELPVTYDDFEAYGVRRASVRRAIEIAERLGFVDLVTPGKRGYGIARRPHKFGLTWLPRRDFTPASNRWKSITDTDAEAILNSYPQLRKRNEPVAKPYLAKPQLAQNRLPDTTPPSYDNATTIYTLPEGSAPSCDQHDATIAQRRRGGAR
jgi:hypothetical protein